MIAQHTRSYGKGEQIEQPDHLRRLIEQKKKARQHRGQDRLTKAVPSGRRFLEAAAAAQYSLRSITTQLIDCLDRYGAAELEMAMQEALVRDVPHPNAVRLVLEKRRDKRQQPPPIQWDVSTDPRVKSLVITPHDLTQYNQLQNPTEEGNHDG